MKKIELHIEALIFSAKHAVNKKDLVASLEKAHEGEEAFSAEKVDKALDKIIEKYQKGDYAYELVKISEGYQFLTKHEYHKTVSHYLNIKDRKKLSRSAMETLSMIAYKQPITKAEIEQIRGVSCDYSIQKLLEKELVEIRGRSEAPGRPLLYATSPFFMDYFGIASVADLPKLKDVEPEKNEIGTPDQ